MSNDYTPEVRAFAAELYAYDTMDEGFGYVREQVQEQYLERALFLTICKPMVAHDAEVAAKALKSVIDKVDLEAIADEWSDGGEDSNRHWAAGNAASTVLNLLYDARNAEIRKAAEQ